MNNVFNRLQTHIIGDVCKKFSKSVSYETLAGGTPAIGTNIKQTQCLCECSAEKPLTAVGTFSAFNNAEKVVEKWLQISPVFRLIKIFGLVTVLSVGIISESRAECEANICYDSWNPGKLTIAEMDALITTSTEN